MAANTSHPWVPMTGAKHPTGSGNVPGSGGGSIPAVSAAHQGHPGQHQQPPAVITLDDDRRRYEAATAESNARRAQDRFMTSLSRPGAHGPPGQPGGLTAPPPSSHAGHTPPPAHGHPLAAHGGQRTAPPGHPGGGHDSRSSLSQPSRPHPSHQHLSQSHHSPGLPRHSPGLPGAVKQHPGAVKSDPGPPPPLAPLVARGSGQPQQQQQPGGPHGGAVNFKPYDFARRNATSPHRPGYGMIPGADPRGGVSSQAYPPQAYSAPPVTTRPVKVTSPQVVMSMYSKASNSPVARPDSSPAMGHQGSSTSAGGIQGPPPAHGGAAPRISSYLPPPPPALSSPFPTGGMTGGPHGMSIMSSVRQPLPPPTSLHGDHNRAPRMATHVGHHPQHVTDDQPLDLGAPTKRKVPEVEGEGPVPAKTVKLESNPTGTESSCNGVLFKVSEPSVLSNSEASNITTVENLAIKKEDQSMASSSSVGFKSEVKIEVKTEVKTEVPTAPTTSPIYVHKLKKAWIAAYNNDDEPKAKKATPSGAAGASDYSAPSTPSNTRATPSPALSNAGSKPGGIKVNGHNKMDNCESAESSDSSSATNKGQKHSYNTGSKGHRGRGGAGVGRGSSRSQGYKGHSGGQTSNKTSDNDGMSDSDECSKDSDTTTSSRRSNNGGNGNVKSRRGRKPKRGRPGGAGDSRGSAASTSSKQDPDESLFDNNLHSHRYHRTGSEVSRENGNPGKNGSVSGSGSGKRAGEKENPFNNPPISVLKKTGDSFLQDSDCFKVAPKLTKCRECKWSQHNKNAGSSASIFCR